MKDQGASITASRAYKRAFANELGEIRAGRFTPSTATIDHKGIAAVVARPSRAKGKARRRKAAKK
jgi:hypothetical protein